MATQRTVGTIFRLGVIVLILWRLGQTAHTDAPSPDYAVPGRLVLPWACGEGYMVTWDSAGHWAGYKATGIAFDFAMREGLPLFAPADGVAYFLRDERPFDTNLGNYIELVVEGDWVVRMAHLRDAQSGERMVRAGELIGYTGRSGVSAPHLHLELLVREGTRWVRPDPARIERFFGLSFADLVEGAIIAHADCPGHLVMDGAITVATRQIQLGEAIELAIPLRYHGLQPVTLHTVQATLYGPQGASVVAEARGAWALDGKTAITVAMQAYPNLPGEWRVGRVTCQTDQKTYGLLAEGEFRVNPTRLKLAKIEASPILNVGDHITLDAWLENQTDRDLTLDDVQLRGIQPNGVIWAASAGQSAMIYAGELKRFTLSSPTVPRAVGLWRITQIGYQRDKHTFFFDQANESFAVFGPELRIERVAMYPIPDGLTIFLYLINVGTREASPDAIEAWGWRPDGEHYFLAANRKVAPIPPGRSVLIQLNVPHEGALGIWRLVEAGYWAGGAYYRLDLPEQPAVALERSNPIGAYP